MVFVREASAYGRIVWEELSWHDPKEGRRDIDIVGHTFHKLALYNTYYVYPNLSIPALEQSWDNPRGNQRSWQLMLGSITFDFIDLDY